MNEKRLLQTLLATAALALPVSALAAGEEYQPPVADVTSADAQSADAQSGDVFPGEDRIVPLRHQDDHIHTRPDGPMALFEAMDQNGDERLEWREAEASDMKPEVFNSLDANGSGDLDTEEYIAISPRPGNDYLENQGREPSPAPDFRVGS